MGRKSRSGRQRVEYYYSYKDTDYLVHMTDAANEVVATFTAATHDSDKHYTYKEDVTKTDSQIFLLDSENPGLGLGFL